MATAAQMEANRRNARKSTGPRTQEGKNQSRCNSLDHGCRADLLVMPHEDPGEFDAQLDGWKLSIRPRNPSEEFLVERIVSLRLQAKRIDRAHTARLNKRMYHGYYEECDKQDEKAIELGQKLFRDACGPRTLHLEREQDEVGQDAEKRRLSDYSVDEDHPVRLVHGLQSTGAGCEWLLERWAALRDLLERGVPWLAPDKLKAVRLLGRQPIDAYDSPVVAQVYLACHVLLNQGGQPFQEILNELAPDERPIYERYLSQRGYESRAPRDAAAARQVLLAIVEKATVELEDKAGVFRELADFDASTAGARLSWDDTPEGERLRRYELTCKRAWQRAFDLLMTIRRTGEELDFATIASVGRSVPTNDTSAIDTPEPFVANVVAPPSETNDEPDPPSEANSDGEKLPNEANSNIHVNSNGRSDGHKELRIDGPQSNRKVGGGAMAGKREVHSSLQQLEAGGHSPLLNLPPQFGVK
jgi:hypothetical protein